MTDGAADPLIASDLANEHFGLEILSPVRASVFFFGPSPGPGMAPLLRYLDQAGIRVTTDVEDMDRDPARVRRIADDCSGFISVFSRERLRTDDSGWCDLVDLNADDIRRPHLVLIDQDLSATTSWTGAQGTVSINTSISIQVQRSYLHGPHDLGIEDVELDMATRAIIDSFIARVCEISVAAPFAFMIGRLERDFAHAREAIRAAVEHEVGMPCLWSGDGRHRLETPSVRLTTQLLLEQATLVIADLTLGPENPENENPSRAHEIGLSVAFNRRLMLCGREPRRYPYFSIGDMQMFFWSDERDLYERASEWLRAEREAIGRTVLNYRLPELDPTYQPVVKPADFSFDAKRRYLWPQTQPYSDLEILAMSASIGGIALSAALTADLDDRLGLAVYPLAGLTAAVALIALPRWSSRLRASLGHVARLVPVALLLGALAFATLALFE